MAFKPTPEQEKAINFNGNILVSAAAGSGKTAVLVERVVSRLCSENDGISADRLLIVTFTNAAAAEMRYRIEKRLDEIIAENPDNVALLVQKHLLSSAKICTIDSFCIDLVRENFEKLGIAPDFKISDGASLSAIDKKVLFKIINRYLEEKNQVFYKLLDIVGAEYDEGNFADFVLRLYNYSCQLPFQENWFNSLSEPYKQGFCRDNLWYKYAFLNAQKVLGDVIASLKNAKELLEVSEKAYSSYYPCFAEAEEMLSKLLEIAKENDWDIFFNELNNFSLPSLPAIRGVGDIFEISAAKDIYKSGTTKALEGIQKLFYADSDFIKGQFIKLREPICLLTDILKEFKDNLFEAYTEINTYTFHNTEHLALSLLCEESDGETRIKAEAEELLNRFDEVMVDEYQDTNDLQDKLFYVLSNRESKLFVVGDVKQSIYGFRGANPTNFLLKKNRYTPVDNANENEAKKIILGNNFRCKPEVCDFVNFFFERFMTECTGEIIYNQEECLIPAATYPKTDEIPTEFHLIASKGSKLSSMELEAEHIADYINSVMSSGAVIKADDTLLRDAKYSDFTILLRSAKTNAPIIAETLKKRGIPVSYNSEDYLETIEISTFLSLLKVIDNPRSDIDLLTVMMSPIFSFTPEEMAEFRINERKGDIYSTVINAANNGNRKAENFLKTLESYRMLAITNTLPKLISLLLLKTDYLDIVSAFNDGDKRRNNLLILSGYAEQLSSNGNSSISGFLKQIEKLSSGLRAAGTSTGGDSVKIMSIHASKGLQFPVCVIAGIGSLFNDNEAHESCLFSTELGLGIKYFDEEDKTKYTTIGREVILNKARAERLEEELRLLYVAMTRTQDKLVFTGTVSDIEKKADELKSLLISSASKITGSVFSRTKSYLDWLILCLLTHPDGKDLRLSGNSILVSETKSQITVKLIDYSVIGNDDVITCKEDIEPDLDLSEYISDNIKFIYPFEDILEIESKASASKLSSSAESGKYSFTARPEFMNEHGLSASQKGTAMHKVMQYFDFEKHNNIEAELERLYEWQFLSENEYESVNRDALKKFFQSGLFERIISSPNYKREMKFLTEVSVNRVAPNIDEKFYDEKIIIQGAVDVCFEEDDGIVILDFKTDRTNDINSLVTAYSEQLNIYAAAAEKIFEKPVKQKIIYSFHLGKEVEV